MKPAILLLFLSLSVWATIFVPQPIGEQINEASSIIQGKFIEKFSKQLPSGAIVTESVFELTKALEDESSNSRVKVLTPGGQIGDRVQMIDGVPVFKPGEEVILLLKKSPEGLWVHNLALGKYLLREQAGKIHLHSEIFPQDPNLTKIPYEFFEQLVRKQFKRSLVRVKIETSTTTTEPIMASNDQGEVKLIHKNLQPKSKLDIKFLTAIFFLACFAVGLYRWKTRSRE